MSRNPETGEASSSAGAGATATPTGATGVVPAETLDILKQATTLTHGLGPHIQSKNYEAYSKFRRIERELAKINTLLPDIGSWEATLRNCLSDLVDKLRSFAEPYHQNTNLEFLASLRLLDSSVKQLLSVLPANLDASSTTLTHVHKHQPALPTPPRKLSLELSELRVNDKLIWASLSDDLRVSYENLDLQLKICLLCFSILPERCLVKKRALIYWWIGEGMVTGTGDKTAEEVGEKVFSELASKGFIKPCNVKKDDDIAAIAPKMEDDPTGLTANGCEMYSWIRRMLISVAGEARFFAFDPSGSGAPCNDTKTRRALLVFGNREEFSGSHQNLSSSDGTSTREESLLTVFNVNELFVEIGLNWISKAKKIGVLQLGQWQYSTAQAHHIEVEDESFLEGLKTQKKLKYISLRGISRITKIPPCIRHLTSLEVLDLKACHNLEELPRSIASLRRLTHLDLSECYLLDGMPEGIEKLSNLQVLKGFVIGHPNKTPCKLEHLAKLKNLRRLSVHIGSEAIHQKEEFGDFKDFNTLRSLTISWGVNLKKKDNRVIRDSLKALSFPPNLKKLDIKGIPVEEKPKWLKPSELENVEKLYIRGGELGSLLDENDRDEWKVKILRLKYLRNLKIVWEELLPKFPDLRYLAVKSGYAHQPDKDGKSNEDKYEYDFVIKESKIELESIKKAIVDTR